MNVWLNFCLDLDLPYIPHHSHTHSLRLIPAVRRTNSIFEESLTVLSGPYPGLLWVLFLTLVLCVCVNRARARDIKEPGKRCSSSSL